MVKSEAVSELLQNFVVMRFSVVQSGPVCLTDGIIS